jgi:hypothetical protein
VSTTLKQDRIIELAIEHLDDLRENDRAPVEYIINQAINDVPADWSPTDPNTEPEDKPGAAGAWEQAERAKATASRTKALVEDALFNRIRRYLTADEYKTVYKD